MTFIYRLFTHGPIIFKHTHPNIVICSSTYLLDFLPAYFFSRKLRIPILYEVKDLWPLSPMILGNISSKHPYIRLLQYAEDYVYQHADGVVSLLSNACSYMNEHGLAPDKYFYIPNGVSVKEFEMNQQSLDSTIVQKLEVLKSQALLCVGYAGSHGVSNALNDLIEAAKLTKNKPIAFILVGHGPEKARLIQQTQDAGLTKVFFFDSIPKNQIPSFLSLMDILFLGWKRSPLYQFGIGPNKLLDYLLSGKPILHACDAPNDPVGMSQAGIVVPPESPESIVAGLERFRAMIPSERLSMGRRGPPVIKKFYDYPILAEKYLETIETIISRFKQ